MEILKFEDAPAPKRAASKKRGVNSSRKTILGIAAAAAIAVVGSTLAANISINTGSGLEFGQGITATAACSGSNAITMTPTSTFTNTGGTSGTFYMSGITFGGKGLDNVTADNTCDGRTFTIQAWDNNASSNALVLSTLGGTAYTQATFQYSSLAGSLTKWSAGVTAGNNGTINSSTGYATVAFNTGTGVATAGQIYKLTLQSQ
jgi:hypothetical protein